MAETVMGAGLTIAGSVASKGDVQLNGRVTGSVEVDGALEVGPEGAILSDVRAGRVSVAGAVEGNIEGRERVDLLGGARLLGNVKAPRLTIADGATFRGQVEMEPRS